MNRDEFEFLINNDNAVLRIPTKRVSLRSQSQATPQQRVGHTKFLAGRAPCEYLALAQFRAAPRGTNEVSKICRINVVEHSCELHRLLI
jgi:hypothetical protein